ncbi:4-hydroxybenzoate 3-monooxygenase [Enemella dayhoffiae]|uniref:4-hydroxybenzoate 3-monooxygenase n=1 Tax=Enemella dayhoffiae TaxID=2016507 RepID=A0A255HBY4_9ACTN|nr:4-hydroxybenzoate 3-monooxygenase [Enemella dayhoffiae]OYO25269.1 4-hydroxybenzoate 3-monooxygenase [Enemella dayhoffiae]
MQPERTQVVIVGAGPAGLMLAHKLHRRGISAINLDLRPRAVIESTHRAGILEDRTVRMLSDEEVSERYRTDGYEHDGVELRIDGEGHRIDFRALVGASVWLYPQTDVFIDLAAARDRDGGDVRFGVRDTACDLSGERPQVRFVDADGHDCLIEADFLVGADGSRSICRDLIPGAERFFREYPYAWYGISCEAPMSSPELIYASSPHGFALISQRTETLQRMYLQTPLPDPANPDSDLDTWSEDRIWDQLAKRVNGNGFELITGRITERVLLPFRSFVQQPMHHGRLVLAGDAAHTVPPTGAKGLNLALADVQVLAEVMQRAVAADDPGLFAEYQRRAIERVWRAQNFSYWFSQLMHTPPPGTNPFDEQRRRGEQEYVTRHRAGQTYVAEAYTGWPNES